ncbi:MAG: coenzyme F420-0:L-glutamate ligase [Solirubrobacteraceae bacterium]
MVSAIAYEGLPEIVARDDLAAMIVEAGASALASASASAPDPSVASDRSGAPPAGAGPIAAGDVLVVAHKVISKAQGRVRALSDVQPSDRAISLAREHGKDPRHVQVVLDESLELLRASHGVLVCVTRHGFVCANAGVDASNVGAGEHPSGETVILLPIDPDDAARQLRRRLHELTDVAPAVVITDSFGRAWRHGQCDMAIGCAGLSPLEDWRGRADAFGRELRATWIAVADELAAVADLARTKDGLQPVVLVRGASAHVTVQDGPGVAALLRPKSEDLFR